MSRSLLRLVEPTCFEHEPPTDPACQSRQLSLFDLRAVHRLACLPMADLHGATFTRALSASRRTLIVDARLYPYFDLPGLSGAGAFRLFDELSCRYVQAPMDLRPPRDQATRWQRRQSIRDVMTPFVEPTSHTGGMFVIVLVNRSAEIEILEENLRGLAGDAKHSWQVQPHEAIVPPGGFDTAG